MPAEVEATLKTALPKGPFARCGFIHQWPLEWVDSGNRPASPKLVLNLRTAAIADIRKPDNLEIHPATVEEGQFCITITASRKNTH